jgi:hypothetical protein
MLRRHHCLQVTSDGITQKVNDDGPTAKRRKLTDLIEAPKAPSGSDRRNLSTTNHSEPRPSNSRQSTTGLEPVPGTSQNHHAPVQHVSQPSVRTRSSPLRRYNSSPVELLFARSHGATSDGIVSAQPISDTALTLMPELSQHTADIAPGPSSSSFLHHHTSHITEQSRQPPILTTAPQSSQSYFTSQFSGHPGLLPTAYFPLL